ncbi:MAG TPA: T9SS type A sorting domain-containing protein [Brumimicrobium sp.]|nr:T9SS type A sorting domain-containing protein [Brumimicrobium sp.]
MKSIKLLVGSALLGAGFLFSFSSNAQSSLGDKKESTENNSTSSSLHNKKWKYVNPISQYQEKSNTENRIISYTRLENDGVRFILKDSTKLNWLGNNNNPNAVGYVLNSWSNFANPQGKIDELKLSNYYHPTSQIHTSMLADSLESKYIWDNLQSQLNNWYTAENTWDANGNIVSYIHKSPNGANWENSTTTNYTYNSDSQIIEVLEQNWTNSVPENRYNTLCTYDGDGNNVENLSKEWDNVNNVWVNLYKDVFTFNFEGQIDQFKEQTWDGSNWENVNRETRDFTNGFTMIAEKWMGTQWENNIQIKITYTNSGNPLIATINEWVSGSWAPSKRFTHSYDGEENLASLIEEEGDGWGWKYDKRYTYTYNSDGSLNDALLEHYDDTASGFVKQKKAVHVFNSNGTSSTVTEEKWDGSGWVEDADENIKYVFYYEENDVTGIKEQLNAKEFNLFPNPAADQLHIRFSDSKSITNLAITDLNGRVVYHTQNSFNTNEVTIPVNNLKNGMYFLNVTSDGQKVAKRFVVKH